MRCEAALGSTCSRDGQAASRSTHRARRRQGSLAQQRQGSRTSLCRGCRIRCSRRCLCSSGEALRCFRFRELLRSEALDVFECLEKIELYCSKKNNNEKSFSELRFCEMIVLVLAFLDFSDRLQHDVFVNANNDMS